MRCCCYQSQTWKFSLSWVTILLFILIQEEAFGMAQHNFHESFDGHGEVRSSTNRSFGLTFFAVFLLISILPLLHHNHPRYWLLNAAAGILVVLLIRPSWLTIPNKYWTRLGLLLGKVMTPIVLGIMFYVLLTPMALMIRICGKDLLSMKLSKKLPSYWVNRTPPGPEPESLKNQF